MWRWAGCSRRSPRTGRPGGRGAAAPSFAGAALLALGAGVLLPAPGEGQTFLTQEEALALAFPPRADVERRTAFLEEAQLERARELAGEADVPSGIVTYYVGRAEDRTLGYAYFDAHRVRTLPEVLMVVVTPEAVVERIEVLKFAEPREYLAPERWLDQFDGAGLDDRLSTKGRIVNLTGATLTSRAVTRAVRRVLALHQVIHGGEDGGGGRGGRP